MMAVNKTESDKAVVLAKAVVRAAEQLGLKQVEAAKVLGIHRTAFSRLKSKPYLSPDSKEGELALLLIGIARSVYALTGGDAKWMTRFMRSPNNQTGGIPCEQVMTIQGLMTVKRFTDAVRGGGS